VTPALSGPGRGLWASRCRRGITKKDTLAAAFVSFGGVGGARSVQQLRETAIELQLAPIRSSVHIPVAVLMAHFQGGIDKGLAELEKSAQVMIDDLLWWTSALKTARKG
jgi:NAD(P)H-dependent FMN reductase